MSNTRNSNSIIVPLLWTVVVVLLLGLAVGGYILVRKTSDLQDQNTQLTSDSESLRTQVNQLRTGPSPTPSINSATATSTPLATPTPTPTPTVSAHPTATPK